MSTLLGQDPENQLSGIRQFAKARDLAVIREFVDYASGARERRPALDEMIKDARQGKFKILIISGIDRLARDTRHLLNLINELNHYGVAIISLRENIDFSSPMGQATLTIFGAVAQLERELTRERIRTALRAKKLAAEATGSGWRCGRKAVITPELCHKIAQLRTAGVSVRNIAKQVGVAKSTVQRVLKPVPITVGKSDLNDS